ncbi:hypothetical protein [Sphingomonas sp. 28-62-11]|uniref:hypothetical protein n=1 Tax=Sphingomonas sp. 28-62-11 TaxID=1970432 RepID=UPI0035A85CC0
MADAADLVLAASRAPRPGAELGRLSEILMQHAAVQDLLAGCGPGVVKIDHRLESLARGLVDVHPHLEEVTTHVQRIAVSGRSARWLVVVASEIIGSFAVDPGPVGCTGVALGLSIEEDVVVIAAAGASGDGPSLHLDGARRLVLAMGGRFRETMVDGVRAIDVAIPCRVFARGVAR